MYVCGLGVRELLQVHGIRVIEHPHTWDQSRKSMFIVRCYWTTPTPVPPPPYCFCKLQAVFSRWKLSGFQMYKGARCFVQQPQNHDAWIHWYCWRFLRRCWNVKVPSYALIRAYVTCMVNVFFHINHVSHTLFINHWKSTWLLYHFHKYFIHSIPHHTNKRYGMIYLINFTFSPNRWLFELQGFYSIFYNVI